MSYDGSAACGCGDRSFATLEALEASAGSLSDINIDVLGVNASHWLSDAERLKPDGAPPLNASDQRRYDRLQADVMRATDRLAAYRLKREQTYTGRPPGLGAHGGQMVPFPVGSGGRRSIGDVVALKRTEPMAPYMGAGATAGDDVGLGPFLKGVVLGDWSGTPPGFQAAMSVGNDTSAGYVVPSRLAGTIIDKARNLATVFRAGAQTVPMDTNTLTIARLATDPTASWKVENAPGIESAPGFEAVILRAKTLVALVKGSVELFEDAADIQGTVDNEFAAVLALELDRAALRGSGAAGEPLGLLNQTGVTVTASVGAPTSYVAFADTPTRTLREANAAEPFAFISSPRTFTKLESLVTGISGDLTRLRPPPAWDAYQKFATNQIPINLGGGTNETEAYIGDFSQMLVGIRTTLTIEASRVAGDGNSSAFSNLQIWVRAYLRADIGLAHPNHFNVLTGVL